MPSRLLSQATPTSVSSGTAFQVTVTYESTAGGALGLSVDAGFTLAPATYELSASSPGSATFPVTITRGAATTKGCTLTFAFGNVLAPRIDEVK